MNAMESRKGARSEAGVSLLEVMVGMSILTSLSLAAVLVFVPVSRQARINREVAIANREASAVLEKVHSVPFADVLEIFPQGGEIPVASLPDGKVLTSYENPATDPLVFRAVLTWDSPNLGAMSRTFDTVLTR
jgi:type II secretory pathway pseudopilin PulG